MIGDSVNEGRAIKVAALAREMMADLGTAA